jgi:hypothetical protein
MNLRDYPILLAVVCFFALWVSAQAGLFLRKKWPRQQDAERDDLMVIMNVSLTLLALIIGFSFSMATTRYDQRKNYEEAEANAIGTEYVRAGILPAADAAAVRELLRSYAAQRVLFYTSRDVKQLKEVNASVDKLQDALWAAVRTPGTAQPSPLAALVLAGMNDVLNSQGYTQAAWWNRIPDAAWILMVIIAVYCTMLFGYTVRCPQRWRSPFFILPLIVAVAFLLIADMDSPRGGVIRVVPQNLMSLSDSLRAPQARQFHREGGDAERFEAQRK